VSWFMSEGVLYWKEVKKRGTLMFEKRNKLFLIVSQICVFYSRYILWKYDSLRFLTWFYHSMAISNVQFTRDFIHWLDFSKKI